MANINFDTSVTGWTAASGSATAVPSSISKTMFESMLTGLTPQSDFFDRSIVVNESGTSTYDFRVESDSQTHALFVDSSTDTVFINTDATVGFPSGMSASDFHLVGKGSALFVEDGTGSPTELRVLDATDSGEANIFAQATGTSSYGRLILRGTEGASIDLQDTAETNDRLTITNEAGKIDFDIYNTSNAKVADPLQIDTATGNVGIGGAAATTSYELRVHGNQHILGDNSGTTTELVIDDPAAAAALLVQGTTGSSQHIRTTTSGEAEIFLSTTAGTVGSANNSLNIRVSGTSTDFLIYDYDTTGGLSNGQAFLDVDNATTSVGIGGNADTNYQLKVVGDTWVYGTLTVGDFAQTNNPYIKSYSNTTDSDIHDSISPGSTTAGLLISGDPAGHIVAAVRANDAGDSFTIAVPDVIDSNNFTPNCDKSIFRATYNTVVINESSRAVDFRVESNNNANMLLVDGGNDAVGIGNTPLTGYELTVSGQVLIGTNTLTGTGATDNSTGGTPFDTTYGPSGTHPATVIISQGTATAGTSLLVQSSSASNTGNSLDNATISLQGDGEPLLQLFDTSGTGNITHLYHSGNSFNLDWAMSNGSTTGTGDQFNILKANQSQQLALIATTAMGVGTGTGQMGANMINFYIDGSDIKVRYSANGSTYTTATLGTLS